MIVVVHLLMMWLPHKVYIEMIRHRLTAPLTTIPWLPMQVLFPKNGASKWRKKQLPGAIRPACDVYVLLSVVASVSRAAH